MVGVPSNISRRALNREYSWGIQVGKGEKKTLWQALEGKCTFMASDIAYARQIMRSTFTGAITFKQIC